MGGCMRMLWAALCAARLAGCASTGQRLAQAAAPQYAASAQAEAACAQAHVVLGQSPQEAAAACAALLGMDAQRAVETARAAASAVRPVHPCWGCPVVHHQREGIWYYPLRPSRVPPRR